MIRIAKISDLEKILEFNKRLFEHERLFGDTYNLEWTYSERGMSYFRKRLTENGGIVLIAEEGNEAVGYLCGFIDHYSFRLINPIAEIENMFVEENFRGKGIGSELVRKFDEVCRSKDVKRIRVGAICQNSGAVNFYRKNGFNDFEMYLEK